MELHVCAQLEAIGLAVRGDGPGFREARTQPQVLVDRGQALIDGAVDHREGRECGRDVRIEPGGRLVVPDLERLGAGADADEKAGGGSRADEGACHDRSSRGVAVLKS